MLEKRHIISMTIDWQAHPQAEDVGTCVACGWEHREPRLIYSDAAERMTAAIERHWFEFDPKLLAAYGPGGALTAQKTEAV